MSLRGPVQLITRAAAKTCSRPRAAFAQDRPRRTSSLAAISEHAPAHDAQAGRSSISASRRSAMRGAMRWRCTSQRGRRWRRNCARSRPRPAVPDARDGGAHRVHHALPRHASALPPSRASSRSSRISAQRRCMMPWDRESRPASAGAMGERKIAAPRDRVHRSGVSVARELERDIDHGESGAEQHHRRILRQPVERIVGPGIGHEERACRKASESFARGGRGGRLPVASTTMSAAISRPSARSTPRAGKSSSRTASPRTMLRPRSRIARDRVLRCAPRDRCRTIRAARKRPARSPPLSVSASSMRADARTASRRSPA